MMEKGIRIEGIYAPSADIVVRDIAGELIIVPLAAGIGDLEDELFTLNETGRAIWSRLDGRTSLAEIARGLAAEYEAEGRTIEEDVSGLAGELLRRGMIVEVRGA
jgi:hypothetical protein